MTRIAIYPGSFDPPTRGHEDLIRRSLLLSDRLIVAVAVNVSKQPLFGVEERLAMLRTAVGQDPRIEFVATSPTRRTPAESSASPALENQ